MSDVTRILSQIEQGDPQAAEQLLPLVYDELRKLAAAKLAQEKPGQTLQATALVHEAYLAAGGDEQIVRGSSALLSCRGRGDAADPDRPRPAPASHPAWRRSAAGSAVRSRNRSREAPPTSCWRWTKPWSGSPPSIRSRPNWSSCATSLGSHEEEAADALGISRATASRYWTFARAWLIEALDENQE